MPTGLVLQNLFEDEHLVILSKPFSVHSAIVHNRDAQTIAGYLCDRYPGIEQASLKPEDCGLVQRLDFPTSGALIAAKSRAAWSGLSELLKQGQIDKCYLALVGGKFPQKKLLSNWIGGRYRNSKRVQVISREPRARERLLSAETEFDLIVSLAQADASLIRARAHVARRHQVRAHAAFLGHPLCGDTIYGSKHPLRETLVGLQLELPEELPEFFLHAEQLSFQHPITKQSVSVTAPVPAPFSELLRDSPLKSL